MHTVMWTFQVPEGTSKDSLRQTIKATAHTYQGIPGLIRKYYLLSQDGNAAGGVYLWKSREDAERLYSDNWKAFILEKYEARPFVTYFDTTVVVDNLTHQIIADD